MYHSLEKCCYKILFKYQIFYTVLCSIVYHNTYYTSPFTIYYYYFYVTDPNMAIKKLSPKN